MTRSATTSVGEHRRIALAAATGTTIEWYDFFGGEWGGAALLAVEHAPRHRRGLFGTYTQFGAPAGQLVLYGVLAAVASTTSNEQFLARCWRVPFLLSIVLIVVGMLIRAKVAESPVFPGMQQSDTRERSPLRTVLTWNLAVIVVAEQVHVR